MSATLRYRADIDGLRAVAVLLVLIFHADLGVVSGGFIGVDVFFVISGYLITSIIVSEVSRGTFSWASFYERRIRRIMPALLIVILASIIIGWFVLVPRDYREFSRSAIAASAFYSNFYFNGRSGYFAPAAETQPLLHTWSLAVEEQFYLLAPGFILLLTVGWLKRFQVPAFLGVFALSLAISVYGVREGWSSAFYLLPSRAFELMIGMALALGLVPAMTSRVLRQVAGLAGLAMIMGAGLFYTSATPFPGLAALVPCLGAALLIHSGVQGDTLTSRVLALRPAVFVGKVSYSLYLWHWPLLAYAAYEFEDQLTATHRVGLLVLAFVLSVASYYWIEQPARRGSILPTRRGAFTATAAAIACCVLVSVGIFASRGALNRLSPEAQAFAAQYVNQHVYTDDCNPEKGASDQYGKLACIIGSNGESSPSFVLWGDSHAQSILPALSELAERKGLKGLAVVRASCPALITAAVDYKSVFGKCLPNTLLIEQLLNANKIRHFVIHSRWASYSEGKLSRDLEEARFSPDANRNREEFVRLFRKTVERLRQSGRTVTILASIPELPFDLPKSLFKDLMRNQERDRSLPATEFANRQANVTAALEQLGTLAGVRVLYPHRVLCNDQRCRTVDGGIPLYIDDDHLSSEGTRQISEVLDLALDVDQATKEAASLCINKVDLRREMLEACE